MAEKLKIRMYATKTCPYCMAARLLLKKKGLDYEEILVTTGTGLRDEMLRLTGGRTVPQILIDDTAIGGFDELNSLEQNGELDRMLDPAHSAPTD